MTIVQTKSLSRARTRLRVRTELSLYGQTLDTGYHLERVLRSWAKPEKWIARRPLIQEGENSSWGARPTGGWIREEQEAWRVTEQSQERASRTWSACALRSHWGVNVTYSLSFLRRLQQESMLHRGEIIDSEIRRLGCKPGFAKD